MRILYVGPLNYGSTCLQRMHAMKELGHAITAVNTKPESVKKTEQSFFYRAKNKIFGPADLVNANEQIIRLFKQDLFDIVWIDKGLTITAETLKTIKELNPKCKIVGYSPDDMGSKHNQSHDFLQCLPSYDFFITTKSFNVKELKCLGCREPVFVDNAFDPNTHKPVNVTAEKKAKFDCSVGFIGSWEKERANSILFLCKNGIPVKVWGNGWAKSKMPQQNLKIEGTALLGEDYARAICSIDINLCFLRKINRDLQTTRSIEIPACGAFMLAERTLEHSMLFKEGKEAEFFGSNEELLEKVRYYLTHETERKRIAIAGRQRCLDNGYSNHERIKKILKKIMNES